MAEVGRNEQCPCGRGMKAKHCCYRQPGRVHKSRLGPWFAHLEAHVGELLRDVDDARLHDLLQRACALTESDSGLQLALPSPYSLAIERCRAAARKVDLDEFNRWVGQAAAELDTPIRRHQLAEALGARQAAHQIELDVALAAWYDLSHDRGSLFFFASVAMSIFASVRDGDGPFEFASAAS